MIPANITGPDLLICVSVIATLSVAIGYALWELGAMVWRKCAQARTRRRVPSPWPIPFAESPVPHRDPWSVLVTVAISALVVAIWCKCGAR